ncbi:hypothetical protein [Oenococcus alcoholitolerans]|uniref:hypothetical protein n=1 Tax=Oenococcus alcoholitolerans TaxID=931074 RepID=UPI003F6FE405
MSKKGTGTPDTAEGCFDAVIEQKLATVFEKPGGNTNDRPAVHLLVCGFLYLKTGKNENLFNDNFRTRYNSNANVSVFDSRQILIDLRS